MESTQILDGNLCRLYHLVKSMLYEAISYEFLLTECELNLLVSILQMVQKVEGFLYVFLGYIVLLDFL